MGGRKELVSPLGYQSLVAVVGLQRGRTVAHETEPVEPVEDAIVDATVAHLNRHVRGLVESQRLTGCRPGEACAVCRCDIDTGGDIWLYKPPHHKTAWKGKRRIIVIGPKAQVLVREFFTPDISDYLFSPRRVTDVFFDRSCEGTTVMGTSGARKVSKCVRKNSTARVWFSFKSRRRLLYASKFGFFSP